MSAEDCTAHRAHCAGSRLAAASLTVRLRSGEETFMRSRQTLSGSEARRPLNSKLQAMAAILLKDQELKPSAIRMLDMRR